MPKKLKTLNAFLHTLGYLKGQQKYKQTKNTQHKALEELFFKPASEGNFLLVQENAKKIYDFINNIKNN